MAAYFFDSSAIFKRYISELGSAWVQRITDPTAGNDIYVAQVTGVEVVSATVRQNPPLPPSHLARVLTDFRDDFQHQYQRLAVNDAVIARAMALAESHRLRGYDAIQLAAAVALQTLRQGTSLPPLTFASADLQLNAAALAEGLTVDDPTSHP